MLKRCTTVILMCIAGLSVFAQDAEFTQFYAAPLYLNPAFAGSARCPRVIMNYRNQWPAISGTFVTYAASYDQLVPSLQGGLGLLVLSDKAGEGTLMTTNISGIYAYHMNVSREFSVNFGGQATYAQKRVDWSKLTFGDMIDPRYGFVYQTQEIQPRDRRSFLDLSAGILGYSNVIYAGVAVNHLTQPDEGFISLKDSPLPMKLTAHFGAMIPIEEYARKVTSYVSPNIMFQMQQKFQQIDVGIYVSRGPLVGGLWYRYKDAAIALIGIQQGIFKFGYSYDITISKLSNATAGSHEFSFSLTFDCHQKKRRFRTIQCPSF